MLPQPLPPLLCQLCTDMPIIYKVNDGSYVKTGEAQEYRLGGGSLVMALMERAHYDIHSTVVYLLIFLDTLLLIKLGMKLNFICAR